jgi:hypothetical protein
MKIKPRQFGLGLTFLLLAVLSCPLGALAQGTAFTYNGRLNNNGVPVNGNYDMRFTIYDASTGNNVIAGPLTITPVAVSNGLFAVRIDFGASVFTGPGRWLNVEVQPPGGSGFAALTPRQEVTSSPYSIKALTAASVVDGGVAANQLSTGGLAPTPGQILSYNGANLFWTDPGVAAGNIWSLAGGNAFYNAGNVGIGTSVPAHRLSIAGGPNWTANLWKGALDLEYGAAMAFRGNVGTNYGIGSANGGLYFFHTAGNPGTTVSPSVFDLELSDSGHLLVGGASSDRAGIPLQVKGNLLVSPGGSGGEFQVGTPGGETGMSVIGANRADIRFDGSTLKLLAGFGPGAMPPENGINVTTGGSVGIGTTTPIAKLDVENTDSGKSAVYGTEYGTSGVGVYGAATAPSGVGVFARNQIGVALFADGNAAQAQDKGGFVKAMVLIHYDGTTPSMVRSYNGVTGASGAQSGFTYSHYQTADLFADLHTTINFGFPISDRFFSLTAISGHTPQGVAVFGFPDAQTIDIRNDGDFYLIVY